jgi:hypothetical protein
MKNKVSILIFFALIIINASILNANKLNPLFDLNVNQLFSDASAQTSEGGMPSSCYIVCCDKDVFVFPPTHVRCQILCVPQYFCVANASSSLLCDFTFFSCEEYCEDTCNPS